jgi:hypothetical protein
MMWNASMLRETRVGLVVSTDYIVAYDDYEDWSKHIAKAMSRSVAYPLLNTIYTSAQAHNLTFLIQIFPA